MSPKDFMGDKVDDEIMKDMGSDAKVPPNEEEVQSVGFPSHQVKPQHGSGMPHGGRSFSDISKELKNAGIREVHFAFPEKKDKQPPKEDDTPNGKNEPEAHPADDQIPQEPGTSDGAPASPSKALSPEGEKQWEAIAEAAHENIEKLLELCQLGGNTASVKPLQAALLSLQQATEESVETSTGQEDPNAHQETDQNVVQQMSARLGDDYNKEAKNKIKQSQNLLKSASVDMSRWSDYLEKNNDHGESGVAYQISESLRGLSADCEEILRQI